MNNDEMIVQNVTFEEEIKEEIKNIQNNTAVSPEVLAIAQQIDPSDSNALIEFGRGPAEEISKFSDKILNSIKNTSVEDSGVMIKQLTLIMKKFDKEDFEEEKKGVFDKLFKKTDDAIQKLFGKYNSVGNEIDKVYAELTTYKNDITKTNKMLDQMYESNLNYYKELEKHIAAGNMSIERLESHDLPILEQKAQSGEELDIVKLEGLKNSIELFKQRLYDLETAKMVSLQMAPQIRIIQKGNYKLVTKIQSAFIVTIPIFKNGLIQAIALKRQKLVSDSLSELDRTTNELLLKNSENLRRQSVDIARLNAGPSVKIETLEKSWSTIMSGIEETSRIEEENKRNREEGLKKLNDMTLKLKEKIKNPQNN